MSSIRINNLIVKDIKLIIFDKDGTLIDIHHYWLKMIQCRVNIIIDRFFQDDPQKDLYHYEISEFLGADLKKNKLKPEGPIGVFPRKQIIKKLQEKLQQLNTHLTEEEIESVFKKADVESEQKLDDFIVLLPGVKKFIDAIWQSDIKIAIATTDNTHRAQLAMQSLNIQDRFSIIVGADLVTNAKPSAEPCLKIFQHENIDPEFTLVVGDHRVDIEMAKNAKARSIAVLTGLGDCEMLKEATYIIKTFYDLEVIV